MKVTEPQCPLGTSWCRRARRRRSANSARRKARSTPLVPGVPGTAVTKRIWEREDPLAHGHFGEHALNEVCRRASHAPPRAGRTKPSALARECDESVVTTGIAVDAQEALGEHTIIQIGSQLAHDEVGDRWAALAGIGEESLEILSDNLVKKRILRLMALVLDGAGSRTRPSERTRGAGAIKQFRCRIWSVGTLPSSGPPSWDRSGVQSHSRPHRRQTQTPRSAAPEWGHATTQANPKDSPATLLER